MIPKNQQVCDEMKNQFNETFQRIDGLKQWFEACFLIRGSESNRSEGNRNQYQDNREPTTSKSPYVHQTPPREEPPTAEPHDEPPTTEPRDEPVTTELHRVPTPRSSP